MRSRVGLLLVVATLLGAACSGGSRARPAAQPSIPVPTSAAPTTSSRAPVPADTAAQLANVHIALKAIVTGLQSPVALAWRTGDPRMYVAEQTGAVRVVDANGRLLSTPALTVGPLADGNEEGLLGITFSRDGTKLYVHYNAPDLSSHIDEYTMRGAVADPATRRQLLVVPQPYSNHNGGEVLTGPDGMLYIGFGDGGNEGDPDNYGQNRTSVLAKILRINPNADGNAPYSIPADNPFVNTPPFRAETYMWGLRNPWRFTFDRATGDLWIGDVGQNTYEEIDMAPAGEKGINWGWSAREGFHAFKGARPNGARDPLLEMAHSTGACAVVGGYVYRGAAIPALRGIYVFGDDCRAPLVGVAAARATVLAQRDLGVAVDQLTSFGEDPAGEIYAASRTGTVFRIIPG